MDTIIRYPSSTAWARIRNRVAARLALLIAMAMFCGLESTAAAGDDQRLSVFVSILPQQYFLRQIGGDLIDIQVMVPPAASPHTYEPRPRQMRAIARAQLYFAIGVPFEKVWLPKIRATNPQLRIIQTDRGIEKIPMVDEGLHPTHNDHAPVSGNDPHIWLAPPLVAIMAGHIQDALVAADPDHASVYQRNYQLFSNQIKALDAEARQVLAPLRGARFMVFHPSWGYFAKTYGLVQIPIEVAGKAPKPAGLQRSIETARSLGITTILVQPQFSQKSAGIIADAIHGRVVTADPMAAAWADNLLRLVWQLQTIAR